MLGLAPCDVITIIAARSTDAIQLLLSLENEKTHKRTYLKMKRPTHRDIARIANVSHVTVSLALRKHRSIPETTRERIEAIAKEIGYRPDPALSALMVYRRGAKPRVYQGSIAWINNFSTEPDRLKDRYLRYYLGAEARCVELGYQLEEFRLTSLEMKFKQLSRVLHARNIEGLLFPPQDRSKHITKAHFDWENFSSIAFGFSLLRPQLDVVTNAQFRSARLALRKLRSLGYRRIGFVAESWFSERTDQNFLAGYLIAERNFRASERVPIHLVARGKSAAEKKAAFYEWFFRSMADAILVVSGKGGEWLRALKPSERNGCGLAMMDVPDDDFRTAGINQNNWMIGRTAVDMLISKMNRNERGIPPIPIRILIEGKWMQGLSAPGPGKTPTN
jgi:DNA-binding LacI/PurR family transcriptional regulator